MNYLDKFLLVVDTCDLFINLEFSIHLAKSQLNPFQSFVSIYLNLIYCETIFVRYFADSVQYLSHEKE